MSTTAEQTAIAQATSAAAKRLEAWVAERADKEVIEDTASDLDAWANFEMGEDVPETFLHDEDGDRRTDYSCVSLHVFRDGNEPVAFFTLLDHDGDEVAAQIEVRMAQTSIAPEVADRIRAAITAGLSVDEA